MAIGLAHNFTTFLVFRVLIGAIGASFESAGEVVGKRLGEEITFYSVWFELRWGITGCLILTVSLITVVFYNHPSTTNVTLFFRTVPIVPETNGRVAEVYVGISGPIAAGAPIFRLDSSKQEAAAETARRRIAEERSALVRTQILPESSLCSRHANNAVRICGRIWTC